MRRFYIPVITVFLLLNIGSVQAQQIAQSRAELEQELQNLETQIKALTQNISETQKQGSSLKNDIKILTQKINQSKLKIQTHDKAISKLNQNITEKNKKMVELDAKAERQRDSLSQIMRKTMYVNDYSLVEFGLQSKSLSSFFEDLDSFSVINRELKESFNEIRTTKVEIEEVKDRKSVV